MITYNRYIDSRDCTWYDSSNIVYSECLDSDSDVKSLRIVFKQGRTYLYKDVAVEDYILFRNAESNGKAFNQYIKKYECVRLPDTSLDELEKKKKEFQEEVGEIEQKNIALSYELVMNPETKDVKLLLNSNVIFEGVEDKINIMKLLRSMSINYKYTETQENDGCGKGESGSQEID